MANEDIKKILEAGIQAPSGSNSQPWKFQVSGNQIKLIAVPEKDHPVLNFGIRGTLIAHGALIENIKIAAENFGYKTSINIFPDKTDLNITAIINLEKAEPVENDLYDAIYKRVTNRKHYRSSPLSRDQKRDLLSVIPGNSNCLVKFIDDPARKKELAEAMSLSEYIIFNNKYLHRIMFEELVFTEKEEKERKSGLYLKTLELKPPQQVAIRLFKRWLIMNLLNKLGVAKTIKKENAETYIDSAAICAIICEERKENFIETGIVLQRFWLKAITIGLSAQIATGILFFWQRVESGEGDMLSEEHKKMINGAYNKIASVCEVKNNQIVSLLFRVGEAKPPSARSSRMEPEIV